MDSKQRVDTPPQVFLLNIASWQQSRPSLDLPTDGNDKTRPVVHYPIDDGDKTLNCLLHDNNPTSLFFDFVPDGNDKTLGFLLHNHDKTLGFLLDDKTTPFFLPDISDKTRPLSQSLS